jgi:hypothetical protein
VPQPGSFSISATRPLRSIRPSIDSAIPWRSAGTRARANPTPDPHERGHRVVLDLDVSRNASCFGVPCRVHHRLSARVHERANGVLDARSQPLDVGRRTKVVPAPMRRAVAVRDRGCRFPGCDRPSGWWDADHVRHWADGGPTARANLIRLSCPHHRTTTPASESS